MVYSILSRKHTTLLQLAVLKLPVLKALPQTSQTLTASSLRAEFLVPVVDRATFAAFSFNIPVSSEHCSATCRMPAFVKLVACNSEYRLDVRRIGAVVCFGAGGSPTLLERRWEPALQLAAPTGETLTRLRCNA